MKTTTKRSATVTASSKTVLAAAWEQVWTSYTAAVRSGDADQLSAAKASVRAWHDRARTTCPNWAF